MMILAQAAADAAAETESAVSTVLHAIADALPFPWNAVAGAALAAAGAIFAWKKSKATPAEKQEGDAEQVKTDN